MAQNTPVYSASCSGCQHHSMERKRKRRSYSEGSPDVSERLTCMCDDRGAPLGWTILRVLLLTFQCCSIL